MTSYINNAVHMTLTYSCFIDQLVQDVKFHLRERHIFTSEVFHEGEKELGVIHHAVQRSNRRRPLTKLIHSLVHVLRQRLQIIQLCFKILPQTHFTSSVTISTKSAIHFNVHSQSQLKAQGKKGVFHPVPSCY